jgi:SPP1 family predicted phage head-tail adaptor
VWANIKHPSGISEIKSDADISIVKASIRIRYRSDLTAGMRVVYGASTYDIQAILPDAESKVFIDLACELVA